MELSIGGPLVEQTQATGLEGSLEQLNRRILAIFHLQLNGEVGFSNLRLSSSSLEYDGLLQ